MIWLAPPACVLAGILIGICLTIVIQHEGWPFA